MPHLRILALNVLGPNFANPKYYPESAQAYLEPRYRLERLIQFLQLHKHNYDIIAVQEITHDTFIAGKMKLGTFNVIAGVLSEFTGAFVQHERDHWIECIKDECHDPEFPYSYIHNGNAIFLRATSVADAEFYDLNLTSGNHAAAAVFTYMHTRVCVTSLHLDSEVATTRIQEFQTLLATQACMNAAVCICAGDFNTRLDTPPYTHILQLYNYVADTNTVPTFALIETPADHHPIDHVIYNSLLQVQQNFKVLCAAHWQSYTTNASRLIANIMYCGSDHVPIASTLSW